MNAKAVHGKLAAIFQDTEDGTVIADKKDPGRFFYLRPSRFPYCGLRKLLEAPKWLDDERLVSLGESFFTGVGTSVHTTYQEFLGRSGQFVGNWKCLECAKVKKFTTYAKCSCGGDTRYEELLVTYKNSVVGHTDGIFRVSPKKGKKSKHYVVDYKTTALYKVSSKDKHKTFPLRSNVEQIKMYVILLELTYGVTIDGWALVYLGRDMPFGNRGRHIVVTDVSEKEKIKLRKKLDRWVKLHKKVLKVTKIGQVDVINKYKLCASMKDYKDNWMDPYNPCSIAPVCFDDKKRTAFATKTLKHRVYPLIEHAPRNIRENLEKK